MIMLLNGKTKIQCIHIFHNTNDKKATENEVRMDLKLIVSQDEPCADNVNPWLR